MGTAATADFGGSSTPRRGSATWAADQLKKISNPVTSTNVAANPRRWSGRIEPLRQTARRGECANQLLGFPSAASLPRLTFSGLPSLAYLPRHNLWHNVSARTSSSGLLKLPTGHWSEPTSGYPHASSITHGGCGACTSSEGPPCADTMCPCALAALGAKWPRGPATAEFPRASPSSRWRAVHKRQ
jgi:hypothetical protein